MYFELLQIPLGGGGASAPCHTPLKNLFTRNI